MTLGLLLSDFASPCDIAKIINSYEDMVTMRRSTVLKHILFRLLKRRIPYHSKVLSRTLEIRRLVKEKFQLCSNGKPTFLLRVDDFPRWDISTDQFLRFHNILSTHEIPYLLGVTPFLCKDPLSTAFQACNEMTKDDMNILRKISECGVEVAMHGFSHQTTNTYRHTELVGVSKQEIERKLIKGIEKFHSNGLKTDFFIPCFNTFDLPSLRILKRYFKVICGGPESILYIGLRLSPSYVEDILYVPSYYPAYGRAKEILPFIENVKKIKENILVPVTVHWSWEIENNFRDVTKLCQFIKGQTGSWTSFLSRAQESKESLFDLSTPNHIES